MRISISILALVGVFALSTAGCTKEVDSTEAPLTASSSAFMAQVEEAMRDAAAGGASELQLEELARARDAGHVTVEVARESITRTVDCIRDLGFTAEYRETQNNSVPVPNLKYGGVGLETADSADRAYEQCSIQESYWLDYLYQTQPSSMEAGEAYLKAQLPVVVACLGREGVDVPADEDISETLGRALTLSQSAPGAVNCLDEAAIDGF